MKIKKFFSENNRIFFKRWQNRAYSVFNSLKKIVIILVLPLIYVILSFNYSFSQNDSVLVKEIIVSSHRKTLNLLQKPGIVNVFNQNMIKKIPSSNLSDMLDGTLGVDIQQRGVDEVQADVSIRGGNFDQVLFLINGIPVSDPQTGHNSFSFPVSLNFIEKIEVLQGPGTNLYGIGAYSGAVNVVTKSSPFLIGANISVGQNYYRSFEVFNSVSIKKLCFSAFFNQKKSDGYFLNTDFDISKLFVSLKYQNKKVSISNQASILLKDYGAYSFYTPKYPFQYESISKFLFSSSAEFGEKFKNKISIYWNYSTDIFQLFREDDDWYRKTGNYFVKNETDTAKFVNNIYQSWAYYKEHNYHITNTIGGTYSATFSSLFGNSIMGLNFQNLNIKSTVLGLNNDTVIIQNRYFLTKGDNRNIINVFFEHDINFYNFNFNFGFNFLYNNKFNSFTSFNSDISYKIKKFSTIYVSAVQGVRLPTFTDLYYNGPDNLGNESLKPEKATTYEFGFKSYNKKILIQSALFYRDAKNTIDWVKFNETDKWQTLNYTKIKTYGFEFSANLFLDKRLIDFISINYTYLYQTKPESNYISKYVLNYLKNNFTISTNHKIIRNLSFSSRVRYFDRNGSFFYYDNNSMIYLEQKFQPNFLLDAGLSYNFKNFNINFEASNILNKEYYDLSYVKLQGRFFKVSLNYVFEK